LLLLPAALKYRATDVLQRVNHLCFVTEVLKSTLPSFLLKRCCYPLLTQYNAEIQEKLQLLASFPRRMWGGGRGQAGEVVFVSGACAKAQICLLERL